MGGSAAREGQEEQGIGAALALRQVPPIVPGLAPRPTQARDAAFINRAVHELRNPLSTILGFAQLMAATPDALSEAQQASVRQIEQAGWLLLRRIETLCDLALVKTGSLELAPEVLPLAEIIDACVAVAEPMAAPEGAHIRLGQPELPLYVYADRARLHQILGGVLEHAMHSRRSGSMVDVASRAVSPARLEIAVRFESHPECFRDLALELSEALAEVMGGSARAETAAEGWCRYVVELNTAPLERTAPLRANVAPGPSRA